MTRSEKIDKVASTYAIDEVKDTCNPASKRGLLYAGFVDGAEWADAHPHWLSVVDDLPKINPNGSEWEYSDDVLVVFKDGSIAVGRYERDNSTGEHYWWLYGVDKDLVVTHWMHLPSPPKKGGKE